MKSPTIVCLCGSTRFYTAFQKANYRETMAGNIVLTVGFYVNAQDTAHGEQVGCTPKQKAALDELHLRKIDMAHEILVLNVDGYIGESTKREIAYAQAHGKRVRWLEDPVQEMTAAAFRAMLEGTLPERNCSCHISPPCLNCEAWSTLDMLDEYVESGVDLNTKMGEFGYPHIRIVPEDWGVWRTGGDWPGRWLGIPNRTRSDAQALLEHLNDPSDLLARRDPKTSAPVFPEVK